jgi:hypothetical protein
MHDRVVAELPKNARQTFRVSLRARGNDVGCELRIAAQNGKGAMVETPSGLRIPLAKLDAVIDALRDARQIAAEAGLLSRSGEDSSQ